MKKLFTIAALSLALAACDPVQPKQTSVDNDGVRTGLITTIEGCNVYAIDRGGASRLIYTTICPPYSGKSASTSYRQSCGKNCDQNVEVPTSRLGGEVDKKFTERLTND